MKIVTCPLFSIEDCRGKFLEVNIHLDAFQLALVKWNEECQSMLVETIKNSILVNI